ncbi:MAG: hypothetical protein J0J01_22880 [Reyranella sp.]|uniref:hypothetical protein n=1 Tax=Reyranella sp. TaxID=1929291 RepID=UPI001ACD4B07|nr:hypothetical protein [Reyranella sp.]
MLFSDEVAKWDFVLFNPPGWPPPSDPALRQRLFECLGREYYSRFEGDQAILRLLQHAPRYLRTGGRILISVNSMVGVDAIISRLHASMQKGGAYRLNFRSLAQRDIDWDWTKDRWRVHAPVIEQLGRWHQDPGSCFVFSEGKIRFAFDIIEATIGEVHIKS